MSLMEMFKVIRANYIHHIRLLVHVFPTAQNLVRYEKNNVIFSLHI